MAKKIKNKYVVLVNVVETVPEGGKPLKLKDVKAAVAACLTPDAPQQLALGKVKVEAF